MFSELLKNSEPYWNLRIQAVIQELLEQNWRDPTEVG